MLCGVSDTDHIAGCAACDEDRMALDKDAQFRWDVTFCKQQVTGVKVFGLADPMQYFTSARGNSAEQAFLEEADPRKLAVAQ